MSNKPVTLGQAVQVRKMAIEKGVSRDVFQTRLDDGTVARFLNSLKPSIGDLARWEANYKKLFEERPDLSQVRIPEKPEGVGPVRLLVCAKELIEWTENHPLEGVQEALKKHFRGWEYTDDLDADITMNDRDPRNGSYAVWVKDVREADEEFANKSAGDLKAEGHTGITELERGLLEGDVFLEKGEHLDRENVTLCTGSRRRDGLVPSGHWGARDGFDVDCCDSARRLPRLRSRRVWA
ncbi:MAG: hypothetical protein HYT69_01400 [Candidatus Zambryskibacteria bacterium]|nr:hypothetical protein [Candidatus Zambryskibacteria bacterium]